MYLNRVELIGFLGNDAETRYTPAATPVTTLSIATKTSWMQDGERKERTEWHKVQAWSKLAEYAATLKKGAHIRVVGELRSREYDGKNGKVSTYEIVAQSILSLRNGQRATAQEPASEERPHRSQRPLRQNRQLPRRSAASGPGSPQTRRHKPPLLLRSSHFGRLAHPKIVRGAAHYDHRRLQVDAQETGESSHLDFLHTNLPSTNLA